MRIHTEGKFWPRVLIAMAPKAAPKKAAKKAAPKKAIAKKKKAARRSPSPGIPGGRVPAPKPRPRPKRSEHSDVVLRAPRPKPGNTQSDTMYVPTKYIFPQNQAPYTHLLQLGEGLSTYMKSNPSKNLGWTTDDGTKKHSHVQYKRMVYWTNVAHEHARVRQAAASYPDNEEGGRKMWEGHVPHLDEARKAAGFRIKDQSKDAGDWAGKLKNLHAASNTDTSKRQNARWTERAESGMFLSPNLSSKRCRGKNTNSTHKTSTRHQSFGRIVNANLRRVDVDLEIQQAQVIYT